MDENNTENREAPKGEAAATGPAIGAAIIVALLLAGALYFWNQNGSREQAKLPLIEGDVQNLNNEQWAQQASTSDSVSTSTKSQP